MSLRRLAPFFIFLGSAHGYVRSITKETGATTFRPTSCVVMEPDSRASRDIPLADFEDVLSRSIANWTTKIGTCSFVTLSAVRADGLPRDVKNDGHPIVVIRDDKWERPDKMIPHDPSSIGLTTVFYVPTGPFAGLVLDTDVELNNVNYTLTNDPANAVERTGRPVADLENTLTHELGHVLGLDHTCYLPSETPRGVTNDGTPVPDCGPGLPATATAATMYYQSAPRETSKRNITDDDKNGICEPYGLDRPPQACHRDLKSGYGCSLSRSATPGFALLVLLVLASAHALRLDRARRRLRGAHRDRGGGEAGREGAADREEGARR
jgi:hypothetical protein